MIRIVIESAEFPVSNPPVLVRVFSGVQPHPAYLGTLKFSQVEVNGFLNMLYAGHAQLLIQGVATTEDLKVEDRREDQDEDEG